MLAGVGCRLGILQTFLAWRDIDILFLFGMCCRGQVVDLVDA